MNYQRKAPSPTMQARPNTAIVSFYSWPLLHGCAYTPIVMREFAHTFPTFIIAVLSLLFLACTSLSSQNQDTSLAVYNRMMKDIRQKVLEYKRNNPPDTIRPYNALRFVESRVGLRDISKGCDSLEYRLWVSPAILMWQEALVIRNMRGNWSSSYLLFDHGNLSDPKRKYIRVAAWPKSPYPTIIDSLNFWQFGDLPDMERIPDLVDMWEDGTQFTFEASGTNKYRFYEYHSPHNFSNDYWQARNAYQIIRYIYSEFRIDSLRNAYWDQLK